MFSHSPVIERSKMSILVKGRRLGGRRIAGGALLVIV
jgi:hypothetical protein